MLLEEIIADFNEKQIQELEKEIEKVENFIQEASKRK